MNVIFVNRIYNLRSITRHLFNFHRKSNYPDPLFLDVFLKFTVLLLISSFKPITYFENFYVEFDPATFLTFLEIKSWPKKSNFVFTAMILYSTFISPFSNEIKNT